MKKKLFILYLLVVYVGNKALAQNDSIEYDPICYRETTMVKIENIEEFLYGNNQKKKGGNQIVFYIITGQFVESTSKYYGKQMVLVSIDTINMQSNIKNFTHIKGILRQNTIRIGETYEFHLRLWGCVIYQMGPIPEFYTVAGVRLPVQICPHQPFRAMELNGLNYRTFPQGTKSRSTERGTGSYPSEKTLTENDN